MSELKPCLMTVGEAIAALEERAIIADDSEPCCNATFPVRLDTLENALDMAIDALRRAQPTNDPLTLDELREMNGEPVWIATKRDAGWDIVNVSNTDGSPYLVYFQVYGHYLKVNDYGKTWLAYRRPPEGSENE